MPKNSIEVLKISANSEKGNAVSEKGNANSIDVLPNTTKKYNNSLLSTNKLTPVETSLKKNEKEDFENLRIEKGRIY